MDKNLLMNVLNVIQKGSLSELNNIPKEARDNILIIAHKEGLIRGIDITKDGVMGKPELTLNGLEFFENNKRSAKFYNTLKEIRDWIPGY